MNCFGDKKKSKSELHPFVIYEDFGSILEPVSGESVGSTQIGNEHLLSGFCAYIDSQYLKLNVAQIIL